jgi:hypothetical protein
MRKFHFWIVLIVVLLLLIGCGEDEQPLTGTWVGTYTDTSLVSALLLLKILSGEEVTEKDWEEYKQLIEEHDVELRLEQDDTIVVGNVTIDKYETMPIRNGSFVGNVLTFSYIEKHLLTEDEEVTVSAELIDEYTLDGEWGDKGFWKATKTP